MAALVISGILKRPVSGEVLPGARITFDAIATGNAVLKGVSSSCKTASDGSYSVALEYGDYTIQVSWGGQVLQYGSVHIESTTPIGSINDLLLQDIIESQVTPEIILDFRALEEEMEEDLAKMTDLNKQAGESATAAGTSASNAANSATDAAASASAAAKSAADADASAKSIEGDADAAAASAAAAAVSEQNAANSASAAARSEANAATSETHAAASETAAADSASAAAISETNADADATAAASSAAAAKTSETNAAASAAAADASAKSIEGDADAAAASAAAAAKSEQNAANSASAAARSEANAATSETHAAASETAAADSASAAAISETNADADVTAAASSAAAAKTSETHAAASETAAGTSEINANNARDAAEEYAQEAKDAASKVTNPLTDQGKWSIQSGYPATPGVASIWQIVDGGVDPVNPEIVWDAGDMLVYLLTAGVWCRLLGQQMAGGEPKPLTFDSDIILNVGAGLQIIAGDTLPVDAVRLDAQNNLVIGDARTPGIALRTAEPTNLFVLVPDGSGGYTKSRIYSEAYPPAPPVYSPDLPGSVMLAYMNALPPDYPCYPNENKQLTILYPEMGYLIAGKYLTYGAMEKSGAEVWLTNRQFTGTWALLSGLAMQYSGTVTTSIGNCLVQSVDVSALGGKTEYIQQAIYFDDPDYVNAVFRLPDERTFTYTAWKFSPLAFNREVYAYCNEHLPSLPEQ